MLTGDVGRSILVRIASPADCNHSVIWKLLMSQRPLQFIAKMVYLNELIRRAVEQ